MTCNERHFVIIKFHQSRGPRVQKQYGHLTESEAQKICQDPKTSTHSKKPYGKNWFLGYSDKSF